MSNGYMIVFNIPIGIMPVCPVVIYLDRQRAEAAAKEINGPAVRIVAVDVDIRRSPGLLGSDWKVLSDGDWKGV